MLDDQSSLAEALDDARGVAKTFKVSARTVQRLAERGDIPHYKVGGQLRFDLAEVRAALRVKSAA